MYRNIQKLTLLDDLRQVHEQVHFLHVSRYSLLALPEIQLFWILEIFLKINKQSLLHQNRLRWLNDQKKNILFMSTRNKFHRSIFDWSLIIYTFIVLQFVLFFFFLPLSAGSIWGSGLRLTEDIVTTIFVRVSPKKLCIQSTYRHFQNIKLFASWPPSSQHQLFNINYGHMYRYYDFNCNFVKFNFEFFNNDKKKELWLREQFGQRKKRFKINNQNCECFERMKVII